MKFNKSYFDMSEDNFPQKIEEFIMSLNNNNKYCIFIKHFVEDTHWRMGGPQLFIQPKFDLHDIVKELVSTIGKQYEKLNALYNYNNNGVICIEYRIFYPHDIYESIRSARTSAVVHNNDINGNYSYHFDSLKKSSKLKLDNIFRELGDIKDIYLSEKFMPFSIKDEKYGVFVKHIDGVDFYRYNKSVNIERICSYPNYFCTVYEDNIKIFSYTDTVSPDGSWIRSKGKLKLYFNNEDVFIKAEGFYSLKFIPPITPEPELIYNSENEDIIDNKLRADLKVLTLDFEAYKVVEDNRTVFKPYVAAVYDGLKVFYYHIKDYVSLNDMLSDIFKKISSYYDYKVYVHNLGNFDIAFILEYLNANYKIKLILKDGKIININVTSKSNVDQASYKIKNSKKVKFKVCDSLLLINQSLDKAAKTFNIKDHKLYYPHDFINETTLNYVGPVPDYKYWNDIKIEDYNEILKTNQIWSATDAIEIYTKRDVILLYDVLFTNYLLIRKNYNIDITKCNTISSISFNILRTLRFFKKAIDKIPVITGSLEKLIREAYYGGFTEVYETRIDNGFAYDVNSMYPYCMLQRMPVGLPVRTTEKNLYKIFGFVNAKITAPDGINKPILPFRNEDGKTILPVGTWIGTYFSEELKNAVKYGYKVEVNYAIQFNADSTIFKDYVEHFHEIKQDKNHPLNPLAKKMLNAPSGRFGMNNDPEITIIINNIQLDYYTSYYDILDITQLDSNYSIIKISSKPNIDIVKKSGASLKHFYDLLNEKENDFTLASVAISAAITAYARIFMSQYIMDPKYGLLYIDTDGIILKNKLPDCLINNNLGSFKLEHIISLAILVAPKSYIIQNHNLDLFSKFKGLNTKLSLSDYIYLYRGNIIKKQIEKWFIHDNKFIIIKKFDITLKRIIDKRLPTIINDIITNTNPIKLNNGKITTRDICKYKTAPITIYKKSPTELIIYTSTIKTD